MHTPETGVIDIGRRRNVEYKRFGARDGQPVLYSHGLPGSASEAALADDFGKEHGLDIVALNRPGISKSTFQPNRTLEKWAEDVERVLERLGIQELDAFMSMSGGGPSTLALAARMHTRARATFLIASPSQLWTSQAAAKMQRLDRLCLWAARRTVTSFFVRAALKAVFCLERNHPGTFFEILRRNARPDDRVLFEQPKFREIMVTTIGEVAHSNPAALVQDMNDIGGPWNFNPRSIPDSHEMHLVHGDSDGTIPVEVIDELGAHVPHAERHRIPGEGHFLLAKDKDKGPAWNLLGKLFGRRKKKRGAGA